MYWKFDIDQRSLTRASDDLLVRSAKLAYPDKYPLKIEFYRGVTPYQFTGNLKATVKPLNQQTSSSALALLFVAVQDAAVAEGILNLHTVAMLEHVKRFGERPVVLELLVEGFQGEEIASWSVLCETSRRYSASDDIAEEVPDLKATEAEAEEGIENNKWMTPLRVWQAVAQWATDTLGSAAYTSSANYAAASHTHGLGDIETALTNAGIELEI